MLSASIKIDSVEKGAQIGLMGKSTKAPFRVIIWLGEEKPTTALAINFINEHITINFSNMPQAQFSDDLARTRNNPEYAAAWDAPS
jgi:hypothetical protein